MSVDSPRTLDPELNALISKLEIPPDVLRPEAILDSSLILNIQHWKENVGSVLNDILDLFRAHEKSLDLNQKASASFALLPFVPSHLWKESQTNEPSIILDEWLTPELLHVTEDISLLPIISKPSYEQVNWILTQKLRPIFKSSPHPHLHSETGRRLPRPAGGSSAMQDYYEAQRWKQYPGIANVVLWCVHATKPEAYEHLWHLIIPPVMTLLDDYEARYKLHGVIIVQEMLGRIPKVVLKRTGVDGLIRQSLRNSLSHLDSSETPDLIKAAICASVQLILQTTTLTTCAKPSSDCFDQLCSLLGEGIISGIWLYAEDKPKVVNATFEALPQLILALGVGTIRFLQVLIPQLSYTLIPRPLVEPDRKLQFSALRILGVILDVCAPKITSWKETILDAIARCWIGIFDEETTTKGERKEQSESDRELVKIELQNLCANLAQVCPTMIKDEYPKFLAADEPVFQNLFIRVPLSNPIYSAVIPDVYP